MRFNLVCLFFLTFSVSQILATSICENLSFSTNESSLSCETIKSCVICYIDDEQIYLESCEDLGNEIDLSGFNLTHICPNAFNDVPNLEIIDLSFNHLVVIPENIFKKLNKLLVINLSYNDLNFLPDLLFQHNTKVQVLDLSHNSLESSGLNSDLFTSLFLLQTLDLSSNLLTEIPTLKQQIFLKCFNLSNNQLRELPEELLGYGKHSFSSLQFLDVSGNPKMRTVLDPEAFGLIASDEKNRTTSAMLESLTKFVFDEGAVTYSPGSCNSDEEINNNLRVESWGIEPDSHACQAGAPFSTFGAGTLFATSSVVALVLVLLGVGALLYKKKRANNYKLLRRHPDGQTSAKYIQGASTDILSLIEPPDLQLTQRPQMAPEIHEQFFDARGSTVLGFGSMDEDNQSMFTTSTVSNLSSATNLAVSRQGTWQRDGGKYFDQDYMRKKLERKLRKKKSAKLEKLRSFSCTDLPTGVNKEYNI